MKHKHAELIKLWADGAEIEVQMKNKKWLQIGDPVWYQDDVYRVKPQRQWVGLTDAEIEIIYAECNVWDKFEYERVLESKLKEKNT